MDKILKRVAVISSGITGTHIAVQFANVGIETYLVTISPYDRTIQKSKSKINESNNIFQILHDEDISHFSHRPSPFRLAIPETAQLISQRNFDDNLDWLSKVDWVVESLEDKIDVKVNFYRKFESIMPPGCIITSNTAILSIEDLCENRSEEFRKHFAITHFSGFPFHTNVLEIVSRPETQPEVMAFLIHNGERVLGKGIVYANDTPHFVANRIWLFSLQTIMRVMIDLKITIDMADKLTGTVIGRPKNASFMALDQIGLDTFIRMSEEVYSGAVGDEKRETFRILEFVKKISNKNISGKMNYEGFYKETTDFKGKRKILSLDYNTMQYNLHREIQFSSLQKAELEPSLPDRLRTLYYATDLAGQFTERHLSDSLIYSANLIPEITNDIVNIDKAMKWGFQWEMGPFEIWDAIGVADSVSKMIKNGYKIPSWIGEMLETGKDSFYSRKAGELYYFDIGTKNTVNVPVKTGIVSLKMLKDCGKKITGNKSASLVDIGEGVACLEFHTKMNVIDDDVISIMKQSIEIVNRKYEGLVIANEGGNFSVGANLAIVLFKAQEGLWNELEIMVKTFQDVCMQLKYMDKPVVAAPIGWTLGGGCELCLSADKVQYAYETKMGLNEVTVGLIPSGGGTKELLIRNAQRAVELQNRNHQLNRSDPMPFLVRAYETIISAKVSMSGPESVKYGYLRATDKMTTNRDYLIGDAKKAVLAMRKENYAPPIPLNEIIVAGRRGIQELKKGFNLLRKEYSATKHDLKIASKVCYVLCGGNISGDVKVSEQYLLDLEREIFLNLAGEPKTQARIQHLLKTGSPLRN